MFPKQYAVTPVAEPLESRRLLAADSLAWQQAALRPVAAEEGSSVSLDGELFTFGGFNDTSYKVHRSVYSFDPIDNNWTLRAQLPTKLTHAATVTDGEHAYLFGGYKGDHPGTDTAESWRFDPDTDTFTRLADLPATTGAGDAVIVGRDVYLLAGRSRAAEVDLAQLWRMDLDDQAAGWQQLADAPAAVNHFAVEHVDGALYLFGGQVREEADEVTQDAVFRYDIATGQWDASPVASLPRPADHFTSQIFAHDGRIVILGGEYYHNDPSSATLIFDPDTFEFSGGIDLPQPRRSGYADVVGDTVVFSSGWDRYQRKDTWTISLDAFDVADNDGGGDNGGGDTGGGDDGCDGGGDSGGGGGDLPEGVLFQESFDESDGATSGTDDGGTAWRTLRTGNARAAVDAGTFLVEGLGGSATWEIDPVAADGAVRVTLSIAGEGTLENGGPYGDWVEVQAVSGGETRTLARLDGPGSADVDATFTPAGDDVRLQIVSFATQAGERYRLDDVVIESATAGTAAAFEEVFDEPAGSRSGRDVGGTAWRVDGRGYVRVVDAALEIQAAPDTVRFVTDPVPLDGRPHVLTLGVDGVGVLERDGRYVDRLTVAAEVDGVRHELASFTGAPPAEPLTLGVPAGTSARILIDALVSGGGEGYRIDDVRLAPGDGPTKEPGFAEVFDEPRGSKAGDADGTGWRLDGPGLFEVRDGLLYAEAVNTEGTLRTDPIAVDPGQVEVAFDLTSAGVMETGGLYHDYVRVSLLDGSREIDLGGFDGNLPGDSAAFRATADVLGDAVTLLIRLRTSAGSEVYTIDNLTVRPA